MRHIGSGGTMNSETSASGLNPVDELAEEYLNRRRRGERPTPAEYADRYPEHAARILEMFPALEFIEKLKPAPDDLASLSNDGGPGRESIDNDSGPRRLGDYTLLHEPGRGGMGIVHEAEHASLKNRVALKVMHPRFRADRAYLQRFQTEARSAARLHHTNIVPVFDYGEQDGVCYYAMQRIVGIGLDQVLEDVRRLRTTAACRTSAISGSSGIGIEAEIARDSLTAVTRRLLTGKYATTTVAFDETANPGTIELDPQTPSSVALTGERSPSTRTAQASTSSTSFAGQPESTYFREDARLGAQVADALDYAHRQGICAPRHQALEPFARQARESLGHRLRPGQAA
jgi:eukaryotic-like serine/threonine-protein kinase